ncbi:hypothetical protein AMTRI_Chr06g176280 [Amborella trichopoda]
MLKQWQTMSLNPKRSTASEEYNFHFKDGLVFLCEVGFFKQLLLILEKNEHKIDKLNLDEAL